MCVSKGGCKRKYIKVRRKKEWYLKLGNKDQDPEAKLTTPTPKGSETLSDT